jgi:hypothetical protein
MSVRLIPSLVALILAGCSVPDDVRIADAEVAEFHKAFNENAFEVMYVTTARHLKDHTSEKDFVSILNSWYRDLGPEIKSERTAWGVEDNTKDGTLITLKYHTLFVNGYADEEFTYEMQYNRAALGHFVFHRKPLDK